MVGPHLCEPSRQRVPVLFQAGTSNDGREFAARNAEAVFMAGTWAECPAGAFVAALMRAVWVGAIASEAAEKRS